MTPYQILLEDILEFGIKRPDRTGTGTISLFGKQVIYNLQDGFPLVTTKKVHFKSVVHELLWMLRGDTNIKYLNDHGVTIWDEWADKDGELGPVYGAQWRSWGDDAIDQIANVIESIKNDPFSRRHIVSSWNPDDIGAMALAPCHTLFQFYVTPDEQGDPELLSCQLYQRSADAFLGVPFNIASYSLLTSIIAKLTGLRPGEFVHTFGDVHLYSNHISQARLQLSREPRPRPILHIYGNQKTVDDFQYEDFELVGYDPYPAIPAPVAV